MNKIELLNRLYEIRKPLINYMPNENTMEYKLLNDLDNLIDELEGENNG
jgi:hypothetical protein